MIRSYYRWHCINEPVTVFILNYDTDSMPCWKSALIVTIVCHKMTNQQKEYRQIYQLSLAKQIAKQNHPKPKLQKYQISNPRLTLRLTQLWTGTCTVQIQHNITGNAQILVIHSYPTVRLRFDETIEAVSPVHLCISHFLDWQHVKVQHLAIIIIICGLI